MYEDKKISRAPNLGLEQVRCESGWKVMAICLLARSCRRSFLSQGSRC